MEPEQRYPRYMNDADRVELTLELLDEAYSALCWIGTDGTFPPVRPAKVQKALDRLDKTMVSLEKHRDGAL